MASLPNASRPGHNQATVRGASWLTGRKHGIVMGSAMRLFRAAGIGGIPHEGMPLPIHNIRPYIAKEVA
jgi:hypothetical protein